MLSSSWHIGDVPERIIWLANALDYVEYDMLSTNFIILKANCFSLNYNSDSVMLYRLYFRLVKWQNVEWLNTI